MCKAYSMPWVVWIAVWWTAALASADPGKPVAVRGWEQGTVSMETYWNLKIAIDPPDAAWVTNERPPVHLVLWTRPPSRWSIPPGITTPFIAGVDAEGHAEAIDHVLDRLPNEDQVTWQPSTTDAARSDQAVIVRSMADPGGRVMLLIEVDGVRILHAGTTATSSTADGQVPSRAPIDVLLLPVGHVMEPRIVRQLQPRIIVPLSGSADAPGSVEEVAKRLRGGGLEATVVRSIGNTMAVRQSDD